MVEFFTFLIVGGFIAAIATFGMVIVVPFVLGVLLLPFAWMAQVFANVRK